MRPSETITYVRLLILLLWVSAAMPGHAQAPNNLPPHWTWQSPLPQGFDLRDLHVFNDSTAVGVGNAGTVVKTADYGRTWQVRKTGSLSDLGTVSFGSDAVGWIGESSVPGTVRKTVDGGLTWAAQPLGISQAVVILDLQFFTAVEGYVLYYVGGSGSTELRHTADGGATWTLRSRFISNDPGRLAFVSPNVGYVTGGKFRSSVQKTVDGGVSWRVVSPTATFDYSSVSFVDATHGWACRAAAPDVYRTRDGGTTWQAQPTGMGGAFASFADTLRGVVATANGYVLTTSDGGQTWSSQYTPVTNVAAVQLRLSGAGWLLAGGGRWLRTAGFGMPWAAADSVPAGLARQAQFPDPTHGWVIKSRYAVGRTADRGASWQAVDLRTKTPANTATSVDWGYGAGTIQAQHFVDRDTGFVAVMDYGDSNQANSTPRLFSLATHDGGQSWALTQQPALNLTSLQTPYPLVLEMKFQSAQRGVLVGARGLLRRTVDGGRTWTIPVAPPARVSRRRSLSHVAWADAQTVYVVGDSLTLLKSTDAGASFQEVPGLAAFNTGLSQPRRWNQVACLAFVSPLVGLVGFGDEVVRTTDGGLTWAFAALPADQSVVRSNFYAFAFSTPREGWAIGPDNLAATADGGQTWTRAAVFSPYSIAVTGAVRLDRYNGWAYSTAGNLLHYSEKFLTTDQLVQTTLCTGDSLNVAFAREGNFNATEQAVRVELSNAHGRFRPGETHLLGQGTASPVRVGLPAGLPASALYRIRVIRADSSVLGGDSGQDLRLIPTPLAPLLATLPGQVLQATLPTASPVSTRYEWEVGGVSVVGATGAQLTPPTSGAYRVRACSATCCGPWSAPSAVVLATVATKAHELHLYPNPARTTLWLERPAGAATATVQLLDVTGRVVWHGTAGAGTYALPVQQVPAGLYLVRLQTPAAPLQVVRVVVEH